MAQVLMERPIGLLEFFRAALLHRWLIAACAAFFTAAAVAAAFLMTPIYRSEVLLAFVSDDDATKGLSTLLTSQLGGLAGLVPGLSLQSGTSSAEAQAVLTSRTFTDRFISDESLIPILFADAWDPEKKVWNADPEDIPTAADAFKLFDTTVRRVIEDPRTGLITLQVEWRDRELAAKWANLLVARANDSIRKEAIDQAQQSINFLNEELGKTSVVEIESSIYELIETQIRTIMLANTREQYAFRVIDPAVVADEDDFVKPNRPLLVAVGFVLGIGVGLLVAFVRFLRGRSPRSEPTAAVS